uniref:Uncharacterized protein n=1 Tax=Avena sativa TaxID=4498 RepID=A0ACD5Z460_AVESA
MQSYLTPFLPNTAMAKQEMHSLFSNFAHVLGMSLENTIQGSQVTPKMELLPVLFMKRSILVTGSAVLSIASRYRALLDRWILHRFAVSQGAPVQSAMILRSCWQGRFLPLFVGIGFLMARLYNYVTIHSHIHGRQVIHSVEANIQGDLAIGNNESYNQQSSLPSLLGSKHDYARLALQCIFSTAMLKAQLAPNAISFKARCLQKKHEIGALRSVVARNGQALTYIAALVTLQMFLQLNRVNTTTWMLPMLFQTTVSRSNAALVGKLVIVLVNSFGILGSAYTIKQHGRAATLTVGIVLMVFCQMAIPLILEFHTGLGGGSRMPRGYTAAMFLLTCVLSCGLSWSWGSMFWTVPGKKSHSSVGQVAGVALNLAFCFAQMQYFLVMIWRLRSAVLAYYAMWIWS